MKEPIVFLLSLHLLVYNFPNTVVETVITGEAISQVHEFFPQFSRTRIMELIRQTGSAEGAINAINNELLEEEAQNNQEQVAEAQDNE